ncbi:hypothetical protein [Pseudomonas amygdali]|nr:hypothetical protein [Pseudomonas amygdali]WIO60035.1 hypothetical protein QO021_09965 [Pseudomonas amygdali pv. lachrymans]
MVITYEKPRARRGQGLKYLIRACPPIQHGQKASNWIGSSHSSVAPSQTMTGKKMAHVVEETVQYLKKTPKSVLGSVVWDTLYQIASKVPVSGIYRCEGCGDEITSNKDDIFPPQNKHQHANKAKVEWRLIVETQTKG